jgi:DNA polymerase III epsilon subunit family exonuclease
MNIKRKTQIERLDHNTELLNDLVVFDLETTGLSPTDSEIIQVAAIRIRRGAMLKKDSFFSYVKPRRKISPFITEYTGINNRHVSRAPKIAEVLIKFSEYCGDSLLVAHNGHRFDVPFIHAACKRRTRSIREVKYIDSMHLSWNLWGRYKGCSHSLDSVASRLRISQKNIKRHDARGDVELTARCVLKLIDKLKYSNKQNKLKIYTGVLPI